MFAFMYGDIYGNKNIKNTFLIKRYFATYVAFSALLKLKFLARVNKSRIYKTHLAKKRNIQIIYNWGIIK